MKLVTKDLGARRRPGARRRRAGRDGRAGGADPRPRPGRYGDAAGEMSAVRLYEELAGVELRLSNGGDSGALEHSAPMRCLTFQATPESPRSRPSSTGTSLPTADRARAHPAQIALRIKKGQLIPVHRGVYAVGNPRPEGIARAAAAVLACGPDAVLSHFSAAALWGLTGWPTIHEVTVPAKRRPSGVRIHIHPTLDAKDIRTRRGIRLTSPARTVMDIAPRQTKGGRQRAVSQALLQKHMRPDQLGATLNRYPHHPGASLLRHPADPTRSEFGAGSRPSASATTSGPRR